jgi:hypothetical protein
MNSERYKNISLPGDECETPRGNGTELRIMRLSKDGLSQFIEVYCAPGECAGEVRVTGIGPVLKNTDVADLRALIGKTFSSREELEHILNGREI